MYSDHPQIQTPDLSTPLWRYINFTKFVSMLDSRSLFFARADKLGDPFEGSIPEVNTAHRSQEIPADALLVLGDFRRAALRFSLVNCWHSGEHESVAMWRLYATQYEGIAIQTTVQALTSSLVGEETVYVGEIEYVDYAKDPIPEGSSLTPFFHKMIEFQHEREVRALYQYFPFQKQPGKFTEWTDQWEVGTNIKVSLEDLIKSVVVAPLAPDWFLELVRSSSERYGLEVPVRRSRLSDTPSY